MRCGVRNRVSQCSSQQAWWKCSCMRWSSIFFCKFLRNLLQAPCETKIVVRISCFCFPRTCLGSRLVFGFSAKYREGRETHSKRLRPHCFNFSITSPHNHCPLDNDPGDPKNNDKNQRKTLQQWGHSFGFQHLHSMILWQNILIFVASNCNSFNKPSENHPQFCMLSRFEFRAQDGGGTLRETANANVAPMLRPDIIMDRDWVVVEFDVSGFFSVGLDISVWMEGCLVGTSGATFLCGIWTLILSDEHPIRQGLSTWTRTANCGDCVRSNLGEGRKHLQHFATSRVRITTKFKKASNSSICFCFHSWSFDANKSSCGLMAGIRTASAWVGNPFLGAHRDKSKNEDWDEFPLQLVNVWIW